MSSAKSEMYFQWSDNEKELHAEFELRQRTFTLDYAIILTRLVLVMKFISRKFGICRSCDPKKLQIGFEWRNILRSIAAKSWKVYWLINYESYLNILTLEGRLFIFRMSSVLLPWSLRIVFIGFWTIYRGVSQTFI